MEYISKSQEDTIEFAKSYAKTLKKGDILLLEGDLGAGKTVFTKGLVLALSKNKQDAISPTFTLVNEYDTQPKIYHFDFYRIKNEDELIAIGIEEYLYGDGICVIEWPERAPLLIGSLSARKIKITKIGDVRKIEF